MVPEERPQPASDKQNEDCRRPPNHREEHRRLTFSLGVADGCAYVQYNRPMWRQGDVLIQAIESVPTEAILRRDLVLAEGAVTGHRHEAQAGQLFELEGTLYLVVSEPWVDVVHPEHGPIRLEKGKYRIWRQREFDGANRARFVMD